MRSGAMLWLVGRGLLAACCLCFSVMTVMAGEPVRKPVDVLAVWRAGETVTPAAVESYGLARCFGHEALSDSVFARMQGKSFPAGCSVRRSDLRYVRCLHYDAEGHVRLGELVCNRLIADDLVEIFRALYNHHYPIERMTLIDNYGADDEQSMRANNSSSFCYRVVKGSRKLSAHARGLAVDINPLYNPCVRRQSDGALRVQPATGRPYVDRSQTFPYKLSKNDLCYRLFIRHGFRWGGGWTHVKDYQHFEKSAP